MLGCSHTDPGGKEANNAEQVIREPMHIPDGPKQLFNTPDLYFAIISSLYEYVIVHLIEKS